MPQGALLPATPIARDPRGTSAPGPTRTPGDARRRGVVYTPPGLADWLARRTLELLPPGPVRVLDPACGQGSLLVAALSDLVAQGQRPESVVGEGLFGLDCDPEAVGACHEALLAAARRLGAPCRALGRAEGRLAQHLHVADALLEPLGASFDAVLGNPPYVRAAYDAPGRRRALRARFETAVGAFNLFVPFAELALRALRPDGAFGLLTSNKWLVADYGSRLRSLLIREAELAWLLDLTESRPFAGVLVSTLAIAGRRHTPTPGHEVQVGRATARAAALEGIPTRPRRQAEVLAGPRSVIGSTVAQRAAARMCAAGPALGEVATVRGGVMGFAYREVCGQLAEATGDTPNQRVLCPGNVGRYEVRWGRPVRLAGSVWRHPVLTGEADGISASAAAFFTRPKVVVRGVARRVSAALDAAGSALLVAVWGVAGGGAPLEALLALLNSRPVAWLHREQLQAARIPRGSYSFPLSWLRQVPVPAGVEGLAAAGAERLAAGDAAAQERVEASIDKMVCELYGLSAAERREVLAGPEAAQ